MISDPIEYTQSLAVYAGFPCVASCFIVRGASCRLSRTRMLVVELGGGEGALYLYRLPNISANTPGWRNGSAQDF